MPVSVIIPVLNEASCIAATIRSSRELRPLEIIVVDGGSTDNTLAEAQQADEVLTSSPGRAVQMNLGASRAKGDVLLFLHADCTLETGALASAERLLQNRTIIAGCFTMRVDQAGAAYRFIDAFASARVRLTGMAYGDQGLFLRRSDFERFGGFPKLRFMEDVFFSRLLHRHGRIALSAKRIFVSARRWRSAGIFRQTLRIWLLLALAWLGVHPDRLARSYFEVR